MLRLRARHQTESSSLKVHFLSVHLQVKDTFDLFCFLSVQIAKCGPSAVTIWSLATQNPFPILVFQILPKKLMQPFLTMNLAGCYFL